MPNATPLLGHQRTLTPLFTAVRSAVMPQALLFMGPQGVGKHTAARQLAATACCLHAEPALRPCNQCTSCTAIARGEHPDIIEVGPPLSSKTDTITADQVREIVRTAGLHRFSGRSRFFIIDPAEGMNAVAANALLKTLEEPREGTSFILVSHAPHRLLPTIKSRCQSISFGVVAHADLVAWLQDRDIPHAPQIARQAQGKPALALQLAGGDYERNQDLLQQLAHVFAGSLGDITAFADFAAGNPIVIAAVLQIIETLIRDAVLITAGCLDDVVYNEHIDALTAWGQQLWPHRVWSCHLAISAARDALQLHISAKLVLETTILRIVTELGRARSQLAVSA